MELEDFMVLKEKPGNRMEKENTHMCFGTGFVVDKMCEDRIIEVKSRWKRISTQTFKRK